MTIGSGLILLDCYRILFLRQPKQRLQVIFLIEYPTRGTQECQKEEDIMGHLHNHVGLTENFDQSENEEFLVNDSP